MSNATILALEPSASQADILRCIASHLVPAKLILVRSRDELLCAVNASTPDLILLPALMAPAEEASLSAFLRNLPNSAHLETLITPILGWPDDELNNAPRGLRRLWTRTPRRSWSFACDPHVFAERLAWSLRCARESRLAQDASRLVHASNTDRRVYRRFTANELPGVRLARFKHGPLVKLVDFSAGGALLETDAPLRPESDATLELVGETLESVVPLRIVRCHVASVNNRRRYFGACSFARPLDLTDVLREPLGDWTQSPSGALDRFDVVVKAIVDRRPAGSLQSIVTALQQVILSRPFDPVARATSDLLAVISATLDLCGEEGVTVDLIEEHLRATLPSLTARFASAPTFVAAAGKEALYFRVSMASTTAPRVLNVELPHASALEDWQFRLLKTSAHIAAFLTTADADLDDRVDPLFAQSMIA